MIPFLLTHPPPKKFSLIANSENLSYSHYILFVFVWKPKYFCCVGTCVSQTFRNSEEPNEMLTWYIADSRLWCKKLSTNHPIAPSLRSHHRIVFLAFLDLNIGLYIPMQEINLEFRKSETAHYKKLSFLSILFHSLYNNVRLKNFVLYA